MKCPYLIKYLNLFAMSQNSLEKKVPSPKELFIKLPYTRAFYITFYVRLIKNKVGHCFPRV